MQVYAHSLDLTAANYQYSIGAFAISLPHVQLLRLCSF
jgi:hypothetical protein